MTTYTTVEIAALVKKSERTVQLWIQKGTLRAQRVSGNRYEVNESDLEPFLPRTVTESLVARIEALEGRVSEIEGKIGQTQEKATVHSPQRATEHSSTPAQASTLPGDLVPLHLFYHGIPPSTVKRRIRDGLLPAIEGEWKQGNHVIKFALDAEGRRRFYGMFHTDTEHFTACVDCPHDNPV
jgi:excisionase family DNA binding protein